MSSARHTFPKRPLFAAPWCGDWLPLGKDWRQVAVLAECADVLVYQDNDALGDANSAAHDYLLRNARATRLPLLWYALLRDSDAVQRAHAQGASAITLHLAVLDDPTLHMLADLAEDLGMQSVAIVNSRTEGERAIKAGARIIAAHDPLLLNALPPSIHRVLLQEHCTAWSVRTPFAAVCTLQCDDAPDLNLRLRERRLGANKICGLRRPYDAFSAYQNGAVFGGLIMVPDTPRYITLADAERVMAAAPLNYVGVFRHAKAQEIASTARYLQLHAVQLHGEETHDDIRRLRKLLPEEVSIWKACSVQPAWYLPAWQEVDVWLLDHGSGGSGQSFDWRLLADLDISSMMLAGGIGVHNAQHAVQLGARGLDISSALEWRPGVKNPRALAQLFHIIKINR